MSEAESFDLYDRLAQTDGGRRLMAEFEKAMLEQQGGYERSQSWLCEDGYIIEYTTTRMVGGPYDGKFMVLLYKPYGKGARGGREAAQRWVRTYMRAFAKRKTARARAETLYWRHNPTRAAKHGKG